MPNFLDSCFEDGWQVVARDEIDWDVDGGPTTEQAVAQEAREENPEGCGEQRSRMKP